MVVVGGVLVALLQSVTLGLVDVLHTRVGIEGGNSGPGEGEMVRTVVEPLLRFRIGRQRAAELPCYPGGDVVQFRLPEADDGQVASSSPLVEHVHVERGNGLIGRIERVASVVK